MIKIRSNIIKADIAQMPTELFIGRTIVIDSTSDVEKAVYYLKGFPILGIDEVSGRLHQRLQQERYLRFS